MFEGVTVMSRLKNLQTLRGMGNKKRELYVYRMKKWQKVNSELLVPGDLISINERQMVITIICLPVMFYYLKVLLL